MYWELQETVFCLQFEVGKYVINQQTETVIQIVAVLFKSTLIVLSSNFIYASTSTRVCPLLCQHSGLCGSVVNETIN